MEEESQKEVPVEQNEDQTITITGISLEDAAKIILQEQDTPGQYHILTQNPDIAESDEQACVTVVQEENPMEGFEQEADLTDQAQETLYITEEMINNGTFQLTDGSMYFTKTIPQTEEGNYNTIYITPDQLKEASQSAQGEEPGVEENKDTNQSESLGNDVKPNEEDCKTVHVNVIRIEGNDDSNPVKDGKEQIKDECEQNGKPAELNDQKTANNEESKEDVKPFVAELDASAQEEVKTIDLSKPIEVTDSTEIIIKGKKCLLMPHPDTGQLCAYPVVNSFTTGKRKRGRPKKTDKKEDEDYNPPSQVDDVKPPVNKMDQVNAVEGLLELSNTGPDGVRRSNRAKKRKTLEDYEMVDDSDEENQRQSTGDDTNYVPPAYAIASMNPGVKRGRGRPRRYPPQGQASTTSIPAVFIPGSTGQTIMMAPIQGIQNLQAFQEQVKSLPSFLTKTSDGVTTINAQILNSINGQIVSSGASQTISISEGQILSAANGEIISTGPDGIISSSGDQSVMSESGFLSETGNRGDSFTATEVLGDIPENSSDNAIVGIENAETEEEDAEKLDTEPCDINESSTSLGDTAQAIVSSIITSGGEEIKDISTSKEGQTILQIPEDLLPMFMPKKDPIKLGLKASEKELEKLKCPKCDFQAFYAQQYQAHIAQHSDDVQKCKCCNFFSFDRDSLLQHFKETHPRCICCVCDFMAEHAYVIKRHMMRHNGDGCTCDICGKTYKDQYILKMHVKMVHMPADVLFECTICFKKFTRKAHLKRHLRIHEAEKPFKCPMCEYRGCERSDISKHILIHEEPKHTCEICGKAFRHIKNKELHMKRHNGQKDYKCGVCDFYGYTFTDIRKHIERRHADIKTLVCDKCGSAFKSEALLREHQKQQCEVFMIEQGFSIATSTGGTSQATVQIPSSLSVDGQHITIDGQQITVEQVIPEEDISLTEDELRESLQNGAITEAQVIEACQVEMDGEEQHVMHIETDMDTDDGLSMSLT